MKDLAGEVREIRRQLGELGTRVSNLVLPSTISAGGGTVKRVQTQLPITGGPFTVEGTIGHATTTVVPGAYKCANVTFDNWGHATAAGAGAIDASASLDFAALAANSSEAKTIAVTGAADGDPVSAGVPAALASHNNTSSFFAWVSASGVVTVRRSVVAADGSDPAAATVKVRVAK